MSSGANVTVKDDEAAMISFAEFLESTPPSRQKLVSDVAYRKSFPSGTTERMLHRPEIQMHCPNDNCNGMRYFRVADKSDEISFREIVRRNIYMRYICNNCQRTVKTFSLFVSLQNQSNLSGECYKFGEMPPFGPPTPARLISMIGPDRDLFLKGRQCENQGLGIGAYSYYRRVVENQKNRIFDNIIKVGNKLSFPKDFIETLQLAKAETQFTKAVDVIKSALPPILLINGLNPLALLHTALSIGLHEQTDERCLELAQDIRLVLGEFSDRLVQALKDDASLNLALSRLASARQSRTPETS